MIEEIQEEPRQASCWPTASRPRSPSGSSTYYGIWRKMGIQAKRLEDIHDWLAYRIICPDRASCYTAMGLVHSLYRPIPGRFKDYISLPKDNGYQSIHTSVLMPSGDSFEVQFRTEEMHEHAEAGIASHWTYKEGRIANRQEINQTSFLRRMVELHQDSQDSRDLVANLKGELVFQRIQVFTPKGDLRSLPGGLHAHRLRLRHPHRGGSPLHRGQGQRPHGAPAPRPPERRPGGDPHPGRPQALPGLAGGRQVRPRPFQDPGLHPRGGAQPRHQHGQGAAGARGPGRRACSLDNAEVHATLETRLKELKYPSWDAYFAAVGFGRITVHRLLEPLLPDTQGERTEKAYDALRRHGAGGQQPGRPLHAGQVLQAHLGGRDRGLHHPRPGHLHPPGQLPPPHLLRPEPGAPGERGLEQAGQGRLRHRGRDQRRRPARAWWPRSPTPSSTRASASSASPAPPARATALMHVALRVKDRAHLVELLSAIRQGEGGLHGGAGAGLRLRERQG